MRFEPRRAFQIAHPVLPTGLPASVGFLEAYGIPRAPLDAAVGRAARDGVDARRALLASGAVSETRYYLCLARHLGVPFVADWPYPRPRSDLRAALASGRVPLANDPRARWLLAPASADIELLLRGRRRRIVPRSIAITTPSHLADILRHRSPARIAYASSEALPDAVPRLSARDATPPACLARVAFALTALAVGAVVGNRLLTDALGVAFLLGLLFRLLVSAEGCAANLEPSPPVPRDADLPFYTVLVPLRDEAAMVPAILAALNRLAYPRAKLEVLVLVESDDAATRGALAGRRLPVGFKVVVVPPGRPGTKPRALNAGLWLARGDLVTVYDAEDRPEPNQLRLAAARFSEGPEELACLQARLAIANGASGLLPKLFAIEYAALFDVLNVGLARCRLPIAIGGTSNHFKARVLRAVGGWDAWNVTEDADLGLRLARFGYVVDMLASTTWEEAPERFEGWLKQRRRWTKGWMQTLIVLARDPIRVASDLGWRHSLAVALMLTNLVTGPLLTPIFLIGVGRNLTLYGIPTPRGAVQIAEATLAVSVLVIGIVGTFWSGHVGARARGRTDLRDLFAFLPYQLMISAAAWGGLIDLARRPFHWHKTQHGEAARAAPHRPPIRRPWRAAGARSSGCRRC